MNETTHPETEKTPKPPMLVLRDQLTMRMGELQTALPAHMSAERFIRVILSAVQINPDLLACDRMSLWNAAMRCANDGLLPDGNEAALVPFKSKVTYIPMYRGLLKKFRNSGQFKWVTAGIVYEGDEYSHFIDETGEHFRHVPADDIADKKIRRVYALATTKDGGSFIADMPLADINKRKAMSRATREDAPWRQWPDEMMKKTAIRVLSRLLPMSSDLDALMRRDEDALLGIEAIDDARTALSERPSTKTALDHFADSATASTSDVSKGSSVDASRGGGQAASKEGVASEPAPAADQQKSATDSLSTAYQRGKDAKAGGLSARTIPGEYRDEQHTQEALCWRAGFEGSPMPPFSEEK